MSETTLGCRMLSALLEECGGSPILAIAMLARMTAAAAGMTFQAHETPEVMVKAAYQAVEEEVDLWLRAHPDEWGGAEWLTAAGLILSAVADQSGQGKGEREPLR